MSSTSFHNHNNNNQVWRHLLPDSVSFALLTPKSTPKVSFVFCTASLPSVITHTVRRWSCQSNPQLSLFCLLCLAHIRPSPSPCLCLCWFQAGLSEDKSSGLICISILLHYGSSVCVGVCLYLVPLICSDWCRFTPSLRRWHSALLVFQFCVCASFVFCDEPTNASGSTLCMGWCFWTNWFMLRNSCCDILSMVGNRHNVLETDTGLANRVKSDCHANTWQIWIWG